MINTWILAAGGKKKGLNLRDWTTNSKLEEG